MFRNSTSFLKSNFNALKLSKFLNVANCDSGEESNSSTSSTNLVEQVGQDFLFKRNKFIDEFYRR
jgi:hypothetical protein